MTDTDTDVAGQRTVVNNPLIDDPNAGIIVAAGDPLPAGLTGYVGNTPNKVDAAANYDDVDAADKAHQGRPATVVVQGGDGVDPEIAARVVDGHNTWFESEADFAARAKSPEPSPAEAAADEKPAAERKPAKPKSPPKGDVTAENVSRAPGKVLDAQFGDADGYPGARASIAKKRAFAAKALKAKGA